MNSVEQILEKTQFSAVIDGVEFTLRLITAEVATMVIGSKVLGLVGPEIKTDEIADVDTLRMIEGYLGACMVSPKLGDASDPEKDTITVEDLGQYAGKILTIVFERSGFERVGNSDISSEDTEEGI
jgi:hypothetical protein